ncbi:hypothetical protein HPB50_014655 [Hyalomma asiaticum]|uniref:Uncharacterized protein n=1 Tax=Hyalomma asiaticum TaxID=266040 RepID=A0ACB7SA16_HYAAI|nr:hypothetical protein HPB50_014655 [Hyalomma asiaticum]
MDKAAERRTRRAAAARARRSDPAVRARDAEASRDSARRRREDPAVRARVAELFQNDTLLTSFIEAADARVITCSPDILAGDHYERNREYYLQLGQRLASRLIAAEKLKQEYPPWPLDAQTFQASPRKRYNVAIPLEAKADHISVGVPETNKERDEVLGASLYMATTLSCLGRHYR